MTNRRSFLATLGALITAPLVGMGRARSLPNIEDTTRRYARLLASFEGPDAGWGIYADLLRSYAADIRAHS